MATMNLLCRIGTVMTFMVLAAMASAGVSAQTNDVDTTFNAVPSSELTSGLSQVVQPDGKVVVVGSKNVVNGVAKADIFRLNTDGTLDNTFNYCGCVITSVGSLKLLPDGRMLVTGSLAGAGRIARLNWDGSLDAVLVNTPSTPFGGTTYTVEAVQPDGRFYVVLRTSAFGNVYFELYRHNLDGSRDMSFTPITLAAGSPISASIRMALLPDGRFYLAVTSGVSGTGSSLKRHNSDGSVDPTWEQPSFSTGFPPAVFIADLAVAADGSVLVSGRFNTVNGAERPNLVRLLSAGNVDMTFSAPNVLWGGRVRILQDGKILFGGNIDVAGAVKLFRLNSNGSLDNTYAMDPSVSAVVSWPEIDSAGGSVFFGQTAEGVSLVRLFSTGARDNAFSPKIAVYGRVHASAVQSDGKVLIAGVFDEMNGIDRNAFARVNADGSLDATFNPGAGFNLPPDMMIVQPDGRILAVGPFTEYNGTSVDGLVRIEPNGTIDSSFAVTLSADPTWVSLEPDGQILIAGSFNTVNGVARTGVARLNSNGSLDNTFNPIVGSAFLRTVVVQGDGKILIGGSFQGVNGFNRANIARLNADGSLDPSFTTSGVGQVIGIWVQPDGKYIYTGTTTIHRLNNNGSTDGGFVAPAFLFGGSSSDVLLHAVLVQPDGSILVGGRFDSAGQATRRNLVRLASNGSLDLLFMPSGTDNRVRTLVPYSTGKVIAGGDFTVINNVSKAGVARLNIAPFIGTTPFDFDGDGKADVAVYRPSSGVWYQLFSSGNPYGSPTFGLAGDIPVPADYDGDGKTDLAIFRPSTGDWWYLTSSTNQVRGAHLGGPGDIPLPGDINNDGTDDFVVYRPSNNTWYRTSITGVNDTKQFGLAGDKPVIGDFDGDGKVDQAIFRPSTGDWWYAASSAGGAHRARHWGQSGDVPAPADYDGDGKTDAAVYRPSTGVWYIVNSSNESFAINAFGLSEDRPIPADYDGDGKADIAVFRPSTGIWYLLRSTAGFAAYNWGLSTDVAIPNAFVAN